MIRIASDDRGFFENRLHLNFLDEVSSNSSTTRVFKETATATISNEGPEPLTLTGVSVAGPFEIANPGDLTNLTLEAGQSVEVEVRFDRDLFPPPPTPIRPNNQSGVFQGALTATSDDALRPSVSLDIAAHWQRKDEGGWEANVNEVWEVLGFGNRIENLPFSDAGGANPLDTFGLYEAIDDLEVLSPHWRIADGFGSATITLIGRYSGPVVESLGVHRPFGRNSLALELETIAAQSQTILPGQSPDSFVGPGGVLHPDFASATFTNETIPDHWQGSDVFSFIAGNFSTDPSINWTGDVPADAPPDAIFGHWLRVFQAVDAAGAILPNTYLAIQDKVGINSDFNDIMFLVTGVEPVSQAPINSAPSAVAVAQDGAFAFTGENGVTVLDPDGAALTNRMTAVLSVSEGALAVNADPAVTVDGSGSALLRITAASAPGGPSAQTLLNDALASLVYTPTPGFVGSDTLRISVNDRALRDVDFAAITVFAPTPDAPPGDAPPVNAAPVVVEAFAADIASAGGAGATVTVTYADDGALDATSFNVSDIAVTGPGGLALAVTGFAVDAAGDGSPRTVTYTVAAPGGFWDAADNGDYAIALAADEVRDVDGLAAAAGPIGSFSVLAPEPPSPPEPPEPPASFRVEAEAFTLAEGFAVKARSWASGGANIEALGHRGEAVATYVFDGISGLYDLALGYFDETDGVARMRLLVNGREIDAFDWDGDFGSDRPRPESLTERLFEDVALEAGDVIELRGTRAPNEPLRTDYLDFTWSDVPLA